MSDPILQKKFSTSPDRVSPSTPHLPLSFEMPHYLGRYSGEVQATTRSEVLEVLAGGTI